MEAEPASDPRGTAEAIARAQAAGPARRRGGHHDHARAGVRGGGRRRARGSGRGRALHPPAAPLPRRGRARHQLPPAATRRCSCSSAPSRDASSSSTRTRTRSPRAIASTRSATRCSSSRWERSASSSRTDGAARLGRMHTARGAVDTPAFMPVATQGTVKSLVPADLRAAGAQIVLANSYHLYLRPGHELVRELGGLHRFMAWDGPILTDSGGFQVWSLSKLRTSREEGVEFRSHVDGSLHFLSPESSVEIQRALGVDIIHPLDECLEHPATEAATERSLALTPRWLARARKRRSGESAGRPGAVRHRAGRRVRRAAAPAGRGGDGGARLRRLLHRRPRGRASRASSDVRVGRAGRRPPARRPAALPDGRGQAAATSWRRWRAASTCSTARMPTRNARNGQVFTPDGPLTISQARFRRDPAPIDAGVPLRGVPPLLARLPPAPVHVARAHRVPAPHRPQRHVLPGAHGGRCARPSRAARSACSGRAFGIATAPAPSPSAAAE